MHYANLVRHLRASEHSDEWTCWSRECLSQKGQFLFHQEACNSGKIGSHTGGRSVGAVGRTESVVDINLRQRSESFCKLGIISLFFRVAPEVLENHTLTAWHPPGHLFNHWANAVRCHPYGTVQKLGEPLHDRLQ